MFAMVAEFHRAFALPLATRPHLPEAPDLRALRVGLLVEEFHEYLTAEAADDLVEIADALTDMAYVICGTALAYGIRPDHRLPSLADPAQPVPALCDGEMRQMLRRMLRNDMALYQAAEASDQLDRVKDALVGLLHSIHAAACSYQIPLNATFREIHRANMSKLDETGRPCYRADGKVIKSACYAPPDLGRILFGTGQNNSTM